MAVDQIDISNWQRGLPLNAARDAGIGSVIAKASEGVGYTDPTYGDFQGWLLAQDQIVGGSYHFARPDLGNGAIAEADWYLSRHAPQCFEPGRPWIFSLDAEGADSSAAWCTNFMDRVSARIGYDCWFYSYISWINSRGVKAYNRPLWIAAPSSPPGQPPNMGWPSVTSHQYGYRSLAGMNVDADLVLTDMATLRKIAGAGGGVDLTGDEHNFLVDLHNGMGALLSVDPNKPAPLIFQILNQLQAVNDRLNKAASVDVNALASAIVAKLPAGGVQVDAQAIAVAVVNELGNRVKA